MSSGWNLLGSGSTTSVPVNKFTDNKDEIQMIIGSGDGVWDKTLPNEFNSLTNLKNGKAYFVNSNEDSLWIINNE